MSETFNALSSVRAARMVDLKALQSSQNCYSTPSTWHSGLRLCASVRTTAPSAFAPVRQLA